MKPILRHPAAPPDFEPPHAYPSDIRHLLAEAAACRAAGANAAVVLLCQKILVRCACERGDAEGKRLWEHADFIEVKALADAGADVRAAVGKIRDLGGGANGNGKARFTSPDEAVKALKWTELVLRCLYETSASQSPSGRPPSGRTSGSRGSMTFAMPGTRGPRIS